MIKYVFSILLAAALTACCCGGGAPHGRRTVCIKAKDPWVRSYCAERPCPCECDDCCEQMGYPEAGCCFE
ncbi:MAG: hypothetical protein JSR80_05390 [Verrucomicrobia bacterium]|nr:hypothetical protein [Verrucomicrobiota bacterium]